MLHGRPHGAENRLWTLTYGQIAYWSRLKLETVRHYAYLKKFDPHDIESVLRFCNQHRAKKGLQPLGT